MARLEDLTTGTRPTGLTPSVESVQWIGERAVKVIFRPGDGQPVRVGAPTYDAAHSPLGPR